MKMANRGVTLTIVLGVIFTGAAVQAASAPDSNSNIKAFGFRDPSLPLEKRIDDLLSRMTIEEKITQMCTESPAISRLGIPAYNWWNECVHGVCAANTTVYPHAIAMASMWNPDLLGKIATAISDEARARYTAGIGGLTYWSPVINMARDPRWGRTQESYGEDPYLVSRLGVAFVKGLQGNDPKYVKVVATPKHLAANNEETRRRFGSSEVPEEVLREYYLPQFRACVVEGKAQSIMGAFNAVNGVPSCANPKLLTDILRGEWGFDGYVVSDCGAIDDLHLGAITDVHPLEDYGYVGHHYVATAPEAAAAALRAGCDLSCGIPPQKYLTDYLLKALKANLVTQEEIDLALGRLLRARFRLGMFDPPEMVLYNRIPKSVIDSPEHRQLARQASCESIVLLKNDKSFLPLDRNKLKSVAVIGLNADRLCLGNYSGSPTRGVTILEGIRNAIGSRAEVKYSLGWGSGKFTPIETACLVPAGEPDKHGLKAEYFDNKDLAGAPKLVRVDEKIDFNWGENAPAAGLPKNYFSVRWTGKLIAPASANYTFEVGGDDGVRLFIDDKIILDKWVNRGFTRDTIDVNLVAGRAYSIKLEYYECEQQAAVTLGWNAEGDKDAAIANAAQAAAAADVAVVVVGLDDSMENEAHDRTNLDLPEVQTALVRAVYKANPHTVVVLINGSALTINWVKDNVPAIVEAWYPGEEGGNAVADVLFGNCNPSGRLPLTFYASMAQLPPFDDYDIRKGRTYMYFKDTPLFAFGHGLSYTTFSYSRLHIPSGKLRPGGVAKITVDVKNTGSRFGQEVVQFYVHDAEASVKRPLKQLQGFQKIALKPGENKTVKFELPYESLSFYDVKRQKFVVEPGRFDIMVGSSSDDIRLRDSLEADD